LHGQSNLSLNCDFAGMDSIYELEMLHLKDMEITFTTFCSQIFKKAISAPNNIWRETQEKIFTQCKSILPDLIDDYDL